MFSSLTKTNPTRNTNVELYRAAKNSLSLFAADHNICLKSNLNFYSLVSDMIDQVEEFATTTDGFAGETVYRSEEYLKSKGITDQLINQEAILKAYSNAICSLIYWAGKAESDDADFSKSNDWY